MLGGGGGGGAGGSLTSTDAKNSFNRLVFSLFPVINVPSLSFKSAILDRAFVCSRTYDQKPFVFVFIS